MAPTASAFDTDEHAQDYGFIFTMDTDDDMDWNYLLDSDAGTAQFSYDVTNADNLAVVGASAVDLTFTFTVSGGTDITVGTDIVEVCGNSDYLLGDNVPSMIYGED